MSYHLIRCGDHNYAPWSIVCCHLIDNTSDKWMPINSDAPEVDYDWVCPDCVQHMETSGDWPTHNLKCVCIHCVRYLRQKYDKGYKNL